MSSALVAQLAVLALTLGAAGVATAGLCFAIIGEDAATFDPAASERAAFDPDDNERRAFELPPPRADLAPPSPQPIDFAAGAAAHDWRVDTNALDAWRAEPVASDPVAAGSLISSGLHRPSSGKASRRS